MKPQKNVIEVESHTLAVAAPSPAELAVMRATASRPRSGILKGLKIS
jgi:hypothetical protein